MARLLQPTRNPFETYLFDINETPLLNADQERELGYRIEDGDSEARDQMVRANLRLVVRIARGYRSTGLALEDLIAEGNLGLLRAVEGFDPSMNTRFSTYASYWIRQSIKRALINTGKTIRIPAYMVELLTKWWRASDQLQEELGRAPTQAEVGRSMNLSKKKLAVIKEGIRVYTAAPQSDQNDDDWSLDEMLVDRRARTPYSDMLESDDLRQALTMLDRMDIREAAVLRLRFGLGGEDPKTLKEIGDRLVLTRERVRQIENEALAKLRDGLDAA